MLHPIRAEAERLLAVPGLNVVVVAAVLAELGAAMTAFASSERLVSWAGLSPGSRESAGQRMQAPARRGSDILRDGVHTASKPCRLTGDGEQVRMPATGGASS